MEIRNFVERYADLAPAERKAALAELRNEADLEEVLGMTNGPKARSAVRILADLGSRIRGFVVSHSDSILKLLRNDDPKVRMNAAQIIGNTSAEEYLPQLIAALDSEGTMFVLPSFLLAIGAAKNDAAHRYLQQYTIRSDLDKHVMEEKGALTKALANFAKREKAHVRILPSDIIMVSTPNTGVTEDALRRAGYKPKTYGKYVAVTGLSDFRSIYKVRAYETAYIYLGSCTVSELPQYLASRENAVWQRTHVETFRLEVKGVSHQVRVELIGKCIAALSRLVNSPSSYSIEVMIDIEDSKAKVFLNPLTDTRFAYRKKSVPASIGCGTAACLMAYASEFFNPEGRVLDDFCGAGTLLFERGYYPFHTLTGVDIHMRAIDAAKENSQYARVHPQFHHMDALKFTLKRYNEILVNLPFGMRVGSHAENQKLYRRYFEVLPTIVTKGGLVVLFTHEKKLTEELLEKAEELEFLKHTDFDAGGLCPAAYCLRYSPL